MKYKDLLTAPGEYWKLSEEEKSKICNGAGPRNFGWAVPDTLYGLSITEAADIHDFMYHIGTTRSYKEAADNTFLDNMVRIIEKETKWNWLKKLRCMRARKYYLAVKELGGPAFENKGA